MKKVKTGNLVFQDKLQVGIASNCPEAVMKALRTIGFSLNNPPKEGLFLGGNEEVDFWLSESFKLSTMVGLGIFDIGFETWMWNPELHNDLGHPQAMPQIMPPVIQKIGSTVSIVGNPEKSDPLQIANLLASLANITTENPDNPDSAH